MIELQYDYNTWVIQYYRFKKNTYQEFIQNVFFKFLNFLPLKEAHYVYISTNTEFALYMSK